MDRSIALASSLCPPARLASPAASSMGFKGWGMLQREGGREGKKETAQVVGERESGKMDGWMMYPVL